MIGHIRATGIAVAALFAAIATPAMALTVDNAPMLVLPSPAVSSGTDASVLVLPDKPAAADPSSIITAPSVQHIAPMITPAGPSISLASMIDAYVSRDTIDAELECLATAVYFEARSEPLEGQLAVAEVVLNRAASGRYPPSLCAVVTQESQFSFVHKGRLPSVAKDSEAWRKAVAIAHIAREKLAGEVAPGVLWYHASRVSPGWGRRLTRVIQIGAHIFYS